MKAPKCRLCGKEHWGSCPGYDSPTPSPSRSTQEPAVVAKPAKATAGSISLPTSPAPQTPVSSPAPSVEAEGPLSSSERQKRHREKRGEEYRAWNRDRMREMRKAAKRGE